MLTQANGLAGDCLLLLLSITFKLLDLLVLGAALVCIFSIFTLYLISVSFDLVEMNSGYTETC